MSKRANDSTRVHATQLKKRRGVGFRTIAIPDSDEEDLSPAASEQFAVVTKMRVKSSGQVGRVSINSIPILEPQESSPLSPLDETAENSVDLTENVVPTVTAKPRKKINDSVSDLSTSTLLDY